MGDNKKKLEKIVLKKCFRLGDFKLASGKKSDYYIDGRIASLDGKGVNLIASIFFKEILKWKGDVVGGLTLGADPIIGAVLAHSGAKKKPLRGFIVRKEAKGHGTGKLVEGVIEKGDKVVILEDVVTTGMSSMKAVNAAKEMGAEVIGVLAVVDREEGGAELFEKEGLKFKAIFNATGLKKAALKKKETEDAPTK